VLARPSTPTTLPALPALLALLELLAGCHAHHGSSGASAPATTKAAGDMAAQAPAVDHALALAGLLPRGADRCVVARPALLDPDRRELFAQVAQAEKLAFLRGVEVLAYASAEREGRDGPGARVSYLRVNGQPETVRRAFEQGSGMSVRWGDFDCGADGCRRVRAAFVGEGLLRIERGRFRAASREGAERLCRRLLERQPAALEVATTRARRLQRGGLASPLRSSTVSVASDAGVRVVRDELMPSREAAEAQRRSLPLARGSAQAPLGIAPRVEVQDAHVRRELVLLWEDLALRRDDQRRMREAELQASRLVALEPASDVDLRDREAVLAQVGYRLEALRHRTDQQAQMQREVRALLEGGLDNAPDDEGLALMLVELLLSARGQHADARPWIERYAGQPGRDGRWAVYRRHLAALSGVDELAALLIRDGLVKRRDARRAASAVIERLPSAPSYAAAERQGIASLPARRARPAR
jgi:hypothetical protein